MPYSTTYRVSQKKAELVWNFNFKRNIAVKLYSYVRFKAYSFSFFMVDNLRNFERWLLSYVYLSASSHLVD